MIIRIAQAADLESIEGIYNQAIRAGFQTGDLQSWGMQKRTEWYLDHDPCEFPIYVCEERNKVVGFASISPYRKGREALRSTVELSIYMGKEFQSRGLGKNLLDHAEDQAKIIGYKNIIAIVLSANEASKKMLLRMGYEQWGYLPDVANFNGTSVSHVYYGKRLMA